MAPITPLLEPTEAVAGDTWIWQKSFQDYPISEGWALSYKFRGLASIDSVSGWFANDGVTWTVTVPATSTSVAAGRLEWWAIVTGSGAYAGQVYTADHGYLTVTPDPRPATPGALQTYNEKMLAVIQLEIQARITGVGSGHESYQISGRALTKIPIEELEKLRGKYAARVWRERHPESLGPTVEFRL